MIDGDTVEIHGQRIRLHGIDAPESGQVCELDKKDVACGQQAAFYLADLLDGKVAPCSRRDTDRYGRIVATCAVAGVDVGSAMVRAGHALAFRRYSPDYVIDEEWAREAKVGMWRYDFLAPWEWRSVTRRRK